MIRKEHALNVRGWLDYMENHGYVFFLEEFEGIYSPEELEEQYQINEHILDMYPLAEWCSEIQ